VRAALVQKFCRGELRAFISRPAAQEYNWHSKRKSQGNDNEVVGDDAPMAVDGTRSVQGVKKMIARGKARRGVFITYG